MCKETRKMLLMFIHEQPYDSVHKKHPMRKMNQIKTLYKIL